MDQTKTGGLIRALRTQKGLTQKALAEAIGVGDKAVSKWERGLGCPDVSLLPELSRVLGVGLETLLSGSLDANDQERGNMKKLNFYVCPTVATSSLPPPRRVCPAAAGRCSRWSPKSRRSRCRWRRSTTAGLSPPPTP